MFRWLALITSGIEHDFIEHESISYTLQPCVKAAIDILSSDEEGPNSNHGGLDGMTVSSQELTGIIQALLDCKLFFGCVKPYI